MLTGAIVWDTDGIMVDLGVISLKYYSLFFLSAFASGYLVLISRFKKHHIDLKLLEKLTIYVFLGTLIGARLGHCFFYDFEYYSSHPFEVILPFAFTPSFRFTGFQGLASHGGGLGIIISALLYSKKYGFSSWFLLDEISLVVPLAGVFIRLGNLMNSEIIGSPSNLPWAFIFIKEDSVPRHPAQLYEAVACMIIFFILYQSMQYNKKTDGYYFGLLLVLLFSFRFFIEILKENQSSFENGMLLDMGQLLSIPFIILGLVIMVVKSQAGNLTNRNKVKTQKSM